MKILSFFYFVAMVISFNPNLAGADQTPTWTKENYLALSKKDQKKFIQDLREVISLMDEKSDFFAESFLIGNSKLSSFAQYFLFQKCMATDFYSGKATYTEASDVAFQEFVDANKNRKNSALTEVQAERAATATLMLIGAANELAKAPDAVKRAALLEKYKNLKKKIYEYNIPEETRELLGANETSIYKLLKEPLSKSENVSIQKKTLPSESIKKNKNMKKENAGKEKIIMEDEKAYSFSSCLYAGFVIQEKVCKAPKILPKNNILNQILNAEAFKCDSTDQVICNPILFGFDTDCNYIEGKPDEFKTCLKSAKPVCVPNSMTVTASCQEKTKADRYLQRAADLVTSNPDMVEDYIKSINQLCDEDQLSKNRLIYLNGKGQKRKNSDAIKLDIVKTCAVAIPKLSEVVTYYKNIKPESKSISTEIQKMKTNTKK